jgi:hypothetical protein
LTADWAGSGAAWAVVSEPATSAADVTAPTAKVAMRDMRTSFLWIRNRTQNSDARQDVPTVIRGGRPDA